MRSEVESAATLQASRDAEHGRHRRCAASALNSSRSARSLHLDARGWRPRRRRSVPTATWTRSRRSRPHRGRALPAESLYAIRTNEQGVPVSPAKGTTIASGGVSAEMKPLHQPAAPVAVVPPRTAVGLSQSRVKQVRTPLDILSFCRRAARAPLSPPDARAPCRAQILNLLDAKGGGQDGGQISDMMRTVESAIPSAPATAGDDGIGDRKVRLGGGGGRRDMSRPQTSPAAAEGEPHAEHHDPLMMAALATAPS